MLKLLLLIIFTVPYWAFADDLKSILNELENHPKWKQLKIKENNIQSKSNSSYLQWGPSLTYNKSKNEYENNSNSESESISASINLFEGGASLTQQLANNYDTAASKAELNLNYIQFKYDFLKKYLSCNYYFKELNSMSNVLSNSQRALDLAQSKMNRGVLSKDDFLQIKLKHQSNISDELEHQLNLNNCIVELSYYKNQIWDWKGLDSFEISLSKLPNSEYKKLNAFKTKEYQELENKHLYYSQWSSYLPSIDLSYSVYPKRDFQSEDKLSQISASWTLFNKGSKWYALQSARFNYLSSIEETKINHLQGNITTSNLKNKLEQEMKVFIIHQENYDISVKLIESNLNNFRQGKSSVNDLLQQQDRHEIRISSLNKSWYNKINTYLEYCALMEKSAEQLF